jgi:sulfonate transport system substrate-binding protein
MLSVISRRVLLLSVWLLLGACSKAPSASEPSLAARGPAGALTPVRIGYQKIGSPFLLKERAEALNKALAASGARAEWIEFQAGPPILEAMRGGAVDLGYVGETPPVFAQAGGVPFVYVASDPAAPRAEAVLVPKSSPLRQLADLKGKKVALNRGSNVHYLLLQALASAKLNLHDIELTFLAPADARSAFDAGKVDAWLIWDPFQAAAELAGARVLHDGTGLVENQFFYVARRAFAEEHGELVSVVLKEFASLSVWAGEHAEDAARLLAKASGISYDALLAAEKRHVYGLKPITPRVLAQQQRIADAFFALEVIPRPVKVSEAVLPVQLYGDAR